MSGRGRVPSRQIVVAFLALCTAAIASPVWAEPRARVEGDVDEALRERIETAIGDVDEPPANRFQARRRARDAAEDAMAVLRSEGYYGAVIEDDIEGDTPPVPVIRVTTGPQFTVSEPAIEWLTPEPAADVVQEALAVLDLDAGDAGRAADVIAAEGRVVARLSQLGYPDAVAGQRRVIVDHAASTLNPTFRIGAGQAVRLDGVILGSPGRTNRRWVERLVPWTPGAAYRPELVAELERRLLETGVYDSVTVALAPRDQITAEGYRPVLVQLSDQPSRLLEAGAGYSTSEGLGVDAAWTWRNRFGRADTLRFDFRLAEIDSRAGVELSLPHWRRPGRTLALTAYALDEDTRAYDRRVAGAGFTLRQRIRETSYLSYGAAIEAGSYGELDVTDLLLPLTPIERNLAILTGQASGYFDYSNDPLDPSQGWRLNVDVQPTVVSGDDTVAFLRATAQVTGYLPVEDDARTVVAGRVRLGTIVGGSGNQIPSDRRFYSGGGGSVRGYDYQGVGPQYEDGTPVGGSSLFEFSIEARRRLFGNFGAAVFIDGGSVGDEQTPDFGNLRYAVGAGIRYQLPFGPIRADIAIPIDPREGDPGFQIYISIGQAF